MPIEFEFSWRLINPSYSLPLGLAFIAVLAIVFYLIGIRLCRTDASAAMRRAALIAELLVAVGIVGILTFAARAKVDSEIRGAERRSDESQREMLGAVSDFGLKNCLFPAESAPPTQAFAALLEACHQWPRIINRPDDFITWWTAKDKFKELANAPGLKPELASSFRFIAQQIQLRIDASNASERSVHKKKVLDSEVSWPLVAACALLAAAGVALKWARAAIDLWSPRGR